MPSNQLRHVSYWLAWQVRCPSVGVLPNEHVCVGAASSRRQSVRTGAPATMSPEHAVSAPPHSIILKSRIDNVVGALLVILSALPCGFCRSSAVPLVPAGSLWRWYTDEAGLGSSAAVAGTGAWSVNNWKHPDFTDSGWSEGPAQLGYGEGDEATVLPFGPNASQKWVSTYFRKRFAVPAGPAVTAIAAPPQGPSSLPPTRA